MMMTALLRKSFADLGKRRARTVFTIVTIALAVSALGLFAVMPVMSEAMTGEVDEANLYDVRLYLGDVPLTEKHLQDLEGIPNVRSVEAKSDFQTRMYIGERRADALVVGIPDLGDQKVDIMMRDSGSDPGRLELLSDVGNRRADLFDVGSTERVRLYDAQGGVISLNLTGEAHCLPYADFPTWGTAVFYTDMETLHAISNTTGVNRLSLDLESTGDEDVTATLAAVEGYLKDNTDFEAFMGLPDIREEGDYPFKDVFEQIMSFFYVLAFMTLFCSLFLISNTMHTMITEQRKEIAQMKAIGGTKLKILRSYLTTSVILGLTGSVSGALLGIAVAYIVGVFLFNAFFGLSLGFAVNVPVVLLSVLAGVTIAVLATLPALLLGLRTTAREGMEDVGLSAGHTSTLVDAVLRRVTFLPRSAQMGLRNVTRKKGRSISTTLQVALAVGMFLGLVAIGFTVPAGIQNIFDDYGTDISTMGQITSSKPLTEDLGSVIMDIDGVAEVDPILYSYGLLEDQQFFIESYEAGSFIYKYERTLYKGRWFTSEECEQRANVVVLHRFLAEDWNVGVGDDVEVTLATGTYTFKVVGLDAGFGDWGMSGFMPIDTMQGLLLLDDIVSGFGIRTETGDHALIDRVSTEIEDRLLERGYIVENSISYVDLEQSIEFNSSIINMMIAVGALIVFITLIGLMSTLTMNVIERTKEIGMLRCVGSSSNSIRSVFGVEGLALALAGWVVGIPLGYAVARFLNLMVYELMDCDFALVFPVWIIFIAGAVTLVLSLIVIQPPLFRAVRFRPGEALRYQ